MLRPIPAHRPCVEAGLQPGLLPARLKLNAKLNKYSARVRAASEWPLQSRRRRGATAPVKSHTAAKRKRHSPRAATKRPAPEKTGTASAASRRDTPHPRHAAQSLQSSRSAASLQLGEVRATARGVPH